MTTTALPSPIIPIRAALRVRVPVRCAHVTEIRWPVTGKVVEARCWAPAAPGEDLCTPHVAVRADERARAAAEPVYLCPTPTSAWFRCRRPLPCTSHDIDNEDVGYARHGHIVVQEPKKGRRRA